MAGSINQIYRNLASTLAQLFFPLVEVALFDQKDTMQCVFNQLATQDELKKNMNGIRVVVLNNRQQVKVAYIQLEQGYYLRILCDVSVFLQFQRVIEQYVKVQNDEDDVKPQEWQKNVDKVVSDFQVKNNKSLDAFSASDKRALVLELEQKGLLKYQDATKVMATTLGVSRATIYNYLKQAHQRSQVEVHQVDAFTNEPFGGNPAGVILHAQHLSEQNMKSIAREMSLSETAFLLPAKQADFTLRYFTQSGHEVKFCGHSTVAALYMIAHKRMFGVRAPGKYAFTLKSHGGLIPVCIIVHDNNAVSIEYQVPKISMVQGVFKHRDVARDLGLPLDIVDTSISVDFESQHQSVFVMTKSLSALHDMEMDYRSARQFSKHHGVVIYVFVSRECVDAENDFHLRCFAPAIGVNEDPFTGSVLGGFAQYALEHHLVNPGHSCLHVEQGHCMQRPGHVEIQIDTHKPSNPAIVRAKARHFFSTQINLGG